jgi:hypothetical protein
MSASSVKFRPTHRIVFGAGEIVVMLVEDRIGWGGPAYTATEWDHAAVPDWELVDGRWLFQGRAPHHLGPYRVVPFHWQDIRALDAATDLLETKKETDHG